MSTQPSTSQSEPRPREISRQEGRKLLDRQAERYLGISGDEFLKRWDAGEYGDPDDRTENPPEVTRLAMLLPFVR